MKNLATFIKHFISFTFVWFVKNWEQVSQITQTSIIADPSKIKEYPEHIYERNQLFLHDILKMIKLNAFYSFHN